MAKAHQYPCPAGGYLQARTDLVTQQFGELLQGLKLPPYWREIVREKMLEAAKKTGLDMELMEGEKERLRLKRGRILKQHREGYIEDEEFEGEMAAVDLALRALEVPEIDGLRLEEVIEAGERLPGMAALWKVSTVEERRDMITQILEPGGLHYDVELKEIAAITPRPEFLPVLRLLEDVIEYEEATGTLVTGRWRRRNRRESSSLQDTLFRLMCHFTPRPPRAADKLPAFYLPGRKVSNGIFLPGRDWSESRESWQNTPTVFTSYVHSHPYAGTKKPSSSSFPLSQKRASC